MSRPFAVFVFLAFSCGALLAAEPAAPLVIEHVTVLPMTADGAPIPDATVTLRDGRIASIESRGKTPRGAGKRIDGRGKFLLPGYTDMHMHLENDRGMRLWTGDKALPDGSVILEEVLTPYLANGVTQVFNLTAMSETIGQRVEVESG